MHNCGFFPSLISWANLQISVRNDSPASDAGALPLGSLATIRHQSRLRTCLPKWLFLVYFCCLLGEKDKRDEMTGYLARAVRMSVFLIRLREKLQTVSPGASRCNHSKFGPVSQGLFSFSQSCLLTEPEFQGLPPVTSIHCLEHVRNDSISSTYVLSDSLYCRHLAVKMLTEI